MFENAELGHRVDKPTYERESPQLRATLLEAQRELAEANLSVIVIVAGVGGAGKAETVGGDRGGHCELSKRSRQIGQFICVFLFPLLYEGNSLCPSGAPWLRVSGVASATG